MKSSLNPPGDRRVRRFDVLAILLGVIAAILWSYANFSLPDYGRGLRCCDAAEYIRLTETSLWEVFEHSSVRVFGYPFFLALVRWACPRDAFILPTIAIQTLLHLGSSFFLFWALRRSGFKIPYIALALLLAHPALNGVNALTLTDGIATSFVSLLLGTVILLLNQDAYVRSKSIALGLLFGITISLRPSISTWMWPCIILVAISMYWIRRSRGGTFRESAKRGIVFLAFYALGYAPIYGHLVKNCYQASGEYCVISSHHFAEWVPVSFRRAIQYGRIWCIVRPGGAFEWRSTEDRVLMGCDVGRENTTAQLVSCYRSNLTKLPWHFFRRVIGIFDNRHLNPYAALLTTPTEYWTIRIFSLAGLVGVFAAALHLAIAVVAGTWARCVYLSFPLLYLAIQINFHPENRYIFPIQPLLVLLAIYSLQPSAFPKRWLYALYIIGSSALAAAFLNMVMGWDSLS